MCLNSSFNGNKVLTCQVGDLVPGNTYRTPDRQTPMVLDLPADYDGFVRVTNEQGQVTSVPTSTKLGHDRAGRLYASRYLNPAPTAIVQG